METKRRNHEVYVNQIMIKSNYFKISGQEIILID